MSAVKTSLAVARSPAGSLDGQPDWPAAGSLAAPAERASFGKAARGPVPREGHAALELAFDRPDPVDLLEMQARTRLPELVPVRYGRMLVSPFAYFRGTSLPMASDLAATPVTGFTVQACGDAHLGNFGVFAAPDGRQVFDINDFDETLAGPWEWDVKRLAASTEIAGRENCFGAKQRRKVVLAAVSSYREAMLAFARMTPLEVRYARLDPTEIRAELKSAANGKLGKTAGQRMISARTRDSLQALAKLTAVVDGRRQIVADPPLIVPVGDLAAAEELPDAAEAADGSEPAICDLLAAYRRALREDSSDLLAGYELGSLARKVVGVSSVGTRCWIVLMLGSPDADPLFLQVKEAEPSALTEFAGPGQYDNQAQRVVAGQRLIQAAPDVFLGWVRVAAGTDGRRHDYYVRQLRDRKLPVDLAGQSPRWLRRFAGYCGWTLARAHARTGDRFAMAGYLGTSVVFDEAIADFAASYANQNDRDFAKLGRAAKSGRITVRKGL
jgi:uncharacterized protein (DUF2252 family)